MSQYLIESQTLTNIADAIRSKNGSTEGIEVRNFADEIENIETGVDLPELTNPGLASDLLPGKELIDANGNVVAGSMVDNGTISVTMDGITTKSVPVPAGYTAGGTVSLTDDIDNEVEAQSDLITQIATAIDGMTNHGVIERTMDGINTKSVDLPVGFISGGTVSLTDDIDNEVESQADLIAQIATALEDKAAGSEPLLQSKTVAPTTSVQSVVADSGYDGLDEVVVTAMPTTNLPTPYILIDESNGLITAQYLQGKSGYVEAGARTSTHQLAFQPATTITPGVMPKVAVPSGYYTGGDIVVLGDNNLLAENIVSGKSIFGVEGTATAGGGTEIEDLFIKRNIENGVGLGNYFNDRVSFIGVGAFYNFAGLYSVSFPACTHIGSSAFYNCIHLSSVSFPACITIYERAFASCANLTSVNFPVCKSIGFSAFYNCSKLTSINFPVCELISGYAFQNCNKLSTVEFPVCTAMYASVFCSCTSLTSISFPSCHQIGDYAFYNCVNLTTADFPKCNVVDGGAFQNCSALTTVSFPVCTSIGNYAFRSCKNLANVDFPKCTKILGYAFCNCTNLTTISFPACTSINTSVFSDCPALTSVNLPVCTSIGSYAFNNCSNLVSVNLPVCTSIVAYAFNKCFNLVSVNLPVCTSIGLYAFQNCSALTTVSFPVCTSIGNYAFRSCTSLSEIYLMASSVCKLSASHAFSATSITSTTGSIFVPASLVDAYKTATNWTYFSNRIFAAEDAAN